LDASGRLQWQLIRDNGHLGIHEMTATGKAIVWHGWADQAITADGTD
jgi:hypothetical protein